MVELVDTTALEAVAARCEGSSPSLGTIRLALLAHGFQPSVTIALSFSKSIKALSLLPLDLAVVSSPAQVLFFLNF